MTYKFHLCNFCGQDFEIDEMSQEYLALHPVASSKKQPSLVEEHFEPVFEDEDQGSSDSDASEDEPNNENTKKKGRVPR